MLNELGLSWVQHNKEWLQKLFVTWNTVQLAVLQNSEAVCTGYTYTLHQAVAATRIGKMTDTTAIVAGAICGHHGGRTKSGALCKNPGKNAGNRCYAHPVSQYEVLFSPGSTLPHVTLSVGPDNKIRTPQSWETLDIVVDHTVYRAVDFFNTPAFMFTPAYLVMNSFINSWQDRCGPVLDFHIICQLGPLHVSSQWPIQRLRGQLQYFGPWRTSDGQDVAQHGYLVGDYTPGIWI